MKRTSKKDISKRLQKILEEGTPKQKALLVCRNWREQNVEELYGEKPLLTEEEVEEVTGSLEGNREKMTFNKWINIFNVYLDIAPVFGLGYAEYQREARHLAQYLSLWEAYEQEADTINTAYLAVKETDSKEAVAAFEDAIKRRGYSLKYAKIKRDENGFFFIDIFGETGLYAIITALRGDVEASYQALKALMVVLEEFMEETRSKEFLPDILETTMKSIKAGHGAFDISEVYSRKELRLRKERGEKITKNDELRAVFPEYEELIPVPEHVEMFRKRLKRLKERG